MNVKRLFVEKKPGFDIEAQKLLADFKENLGLGGIEKVRIVLRYDVEGLSESDYERAVSTVFSEPPVDTVTLEKLPKSDEFVFAVEYLPGQYDQRADSAAQCIQLLTRGERPDVRTAKLYMISGKLGEEDQRRLVDYVINPVDSRQARLEKPETLEMKLNIPSEVDTVSGFNRMTQEEVERYCAENGFAMSPQDMLFTQEYFKKEEKRDPTITELRVIDTYWSDHCRHTTFMTRINHVDFEEGPVGEYIKKLYEEYLSTRSYVHENKTKDVCLMDMATLYVKEAKKRGYLKDLDESEEINACSIKQAVRTEKDVRDYLIMFKNETHNHPTEIEPFGGAATCLGGAIRDPLSGRSYVYHAMRVTGCADPREKVEDTLPHKLPQKKLTLGAAQGYSSYGNQIGLATGLVSEVYHPGYKAKRMEIGAVVGAAPIENVVRKRPKRGDVIILIGGRTGRDGIGGATGSSKAHDEKSIEDCGAEVQKGNPITERKLQRLFRNPDFSKLVKRCNDFGAGGVCVAIGELADSLDIDLDRVPKKYEGLDGTEIAISESQERMAVVVDPKDARRVLELSDQENLEATRVAVVTDGGRIRLSWNGQVIVNIKREFLNTNGVTQEANAFIQNTDIADLFEEEIAGDLAGTLKKLLGDLNICSQKGLTEMFDSTIGASTVNMPLGGKTQLTPIQTMAARVPLEDTEALTATLMSYGLDPYLMEKSPMHGAVYSIVSSVAKLVAAGGDYRRAWLTLQEYFERLNLDPEKWGRPISALLGAWYAQRELGIAAIGGKDSMSGTFMDICVPPTVCSFALCTQDVEALISPEFKMPGNQVYLLPIDRDEMGLPVFEDLKNKYSLVSRLIREGKIVSAYAVDRGGVLAGAAKMAMGNMIGVEFEEGLGLKQLTRKQYGALIVEARELAEYEPFERLARLVHLKHIKVGRQKVSLEDCVTAFTGTLEKIFPVKTGQGEMPETKTFTKRAYNSSGLRYAHPRVIIPVFPGTNCEYDSRKALEKAGASVVTVVLKNLNARDIDDSILHLETLIKNAQMIMLPGGFSGGDEPDGSGKFIATVFRNARISDAVMELLKNRDGLMLGICNGFQALIKLGLLPYGEIRQMNEASPTLTFNKIGRHVSRLVNTRITSVNSPWLANVRAGEVHTVAVSHGEGRFVADPKEIERLFAWGQVATQYVDESGKPSMDIDYNPNGSMYAVEGLISPDGRVLGKMGHSERFTGNNLKNVPGEKDQKIFLSGVQYYK